MDTLTSYRKQALKLAAIEALGGGEGYVARIPGFRGLLGTGRTKKETMHDLESALEGWIELALKRGLGLPAVTKREAEMISAA
jgi:predicted RNase H-like HicB family nuclease